MFENESYGGKSYVSWQPALAKPLVWVRVKQKTGTRRGTEGDGFRPGVVLYRNGNIRTVVDKNKCGD